MTWPHVSGTITPDGHATVKIAGVSRLNSQFSDVAEAREGIREVITSYARDFSRTLTATLTDPDGTWRVCITTGGDVEPADVATATKLRKKWITR